MSLLSSPRGGNLGKHLNLKTVVFLRMANINIKT